MQRISPAGSDAIEPEVAVDPDGDAVYTWTNDQPTFDQIQARARAAAGALSPTQDISPQSMAADSSAVAVDDSGDAIISWGDAPAGIEGIQTRASIVAAGALGPVQPVSPPANAVLSRNEQGALAVDADGDALYTWQVSDGTNRRVQARARSAAGVLGRVRTLSAAGQDAREAQIAAAPDGDAVFTWARSDGTSFRVQARTRTAAGALGRPQTLSPGRARRPRSGGRGRAHRWIRFSRGRAPTARISACRRGRGAATGALSPVQTASAAGQDASTPGIGVDAEANAVLFWFQPVPPFTVIQARELTAAGSLQATQTLSGDAQTGPDLNLAVNPDGVAAAVWEFTDGANRPVQGAIGP